MGYEQAASTQLLATNCAACGRPLRDAESVEAGMGPDCREKLGLDAAGAPPSWSRAEALLRAAGHELPPGWGEDAHRACNALVHRAAIAQRTAPLALAGAIGALGYERLGARLAERLREEALVVVELEGAELLVRAPYSERFLVEVRRVRGARWDRDAKVRRVPATERRALWDALRASYPAGALVRCGEKLAVL